MDVDTKQRIQSGLVFLLEFYKVLMGTLLILFVPQRCGDDRHLCTFRESETACLVVNCVSCLMMLQLYYIELRRENWCIKYLDIDPAKPNNNLDTEIEKYPEYKERMLAINTKYRRSAVACAAAQVANILMSTVYIGLRWAGTMSLTPLVSYVILMASKLYSTYFVSTASIKKERAFSAYLTIAKTYNTIDADFKKSVDGASV
jgi:hypothetical protein